MQILSTTSPTQKSDSVLKELPAEALQAAMLAAEIGVWHWDIQRDTFSYSDLALSILGLKNTEPVTSEIFRALTHPEDFPRTVEISRRALDPDLRSAEVYSYRIIRPDTGETRWIQGHGLAQFATIEGVETAVTYAGSIQDVTERRVMQDALADQEARLRLAIEAGEMAVWDLDIVTDTITPSPDLNRLFGFPADATPTTTDFRKLYAPGEEDRLQTTSAEQMANGSTKVQSEVRYILQDGQERTFLLRADIRPETPPFRRAIGVLIDVTERVRYEQQITTVAMEMRHRLKNAFAVISAIASRSWPISDRDEGLKWFRGRLQAISSATDLMFQHDADEPMLKELVDRIVAPYRHPGLDPFSLAGSDVTVPPALATPVAMALHELATNAVKYGALSVPDGRVMISWNMEPDGDVNIVWQEASGPAVITPQQKGFGSTLLGGALFPAPHQIDHIFHKDGVRCVIVLRPK